MTQKPSYLTKTPTGILLAVRVQPGSSKNQICGPVPHATNHGINNHPSSSLKIKIASPPVDGAANKTLILFLSKQVKISPRSIQIIAGEKSKNKLIQIDALSVDELLKNLDLSKTDS